MDYTPGYGKRPLWQWIIIYLIIGGLVYAGIYYAFPRNKGSYPPNSTAGINSTVRSSSITYGANGFEPKSITISLGQTVTWTNLGVADVDVASSPHPTHTDYPPLNIGVIANGESKSLMFPVPGVYKYHDHLNPGRYGSIAVE